MSAFPIHRQRHPTIRYSPSQLILLERVRGDDVPSVARENNFGNQNYRYPAAQGAAMAKGGSICDQCAVVHRSARSMAADMVACKLISNYPHTLLLEYICKSPS